MIDNFSVPFLCNMRHCIKDVQWLICMTVKGGGTVTLSALFASCLYRSYTHVAEGADYSLSAVGDTLYIYFEESSGALDWKNNLDFPAKPYHRMGDGTWYAHRGFLRVFKAVLPYIAAPVADLRYRKIVTVGYSHGGALAMLCHEYVWYNRPDLRAQIEGYGFGAPRVFFGVRTKGLRMRWERFTVVRNGCDLVTHMPPAFLGYKHMGTLLTVGTREAYSPIDAHRADNILRSLRAMPPQAEAEKQKKSPVFEKTVKRD